MKKILFMALGIISLMVACSPTRGLVRNPKIANTNSPEITITSIEFGNTETIVEMSFTLPAESGYWVRFNESTFLLTDRGGKYQIREVEGLKLGEKYISLLSKTKCRPSASSRWMWTTVGRFRAYRLTN